MNADLRRALIRAPANAVYVSLISPRAFITEVGLIPRRDLTLAGPSILCEESLIEIDRPIHVASDVVMTDKQRQALQYHQRRRA